MITLDEERAFKVFLYPKNKPNLVQSTTKILPVIFYRNKHIVAMSLYLRLIIIFYFQLLGIAVTHAQVSTSEIVEYEEQLSNIFNSSAHDTLRLISLLESIDSKNHELADISIEYIHKGINLAHGLKLSSWEGEYYNKLGWVYIILSQKDKSEIAHEKSLELFKSSKKLKRQIDLMHTLIESYAINNAADKALKHGYEALDLCHKIDDEDCQGQTYKRMARTMYNFKENSKGVEFSKKAVEVFEKNKNNKALAKCYADIAKYGLYDYEESLSIMNKSLALIEKDTSKNAYDLSNALFSRILLSQRFQKYEEADIDINHIKDELWNDLSTRQQQNLDMLNGRNKYEQGKYEASIDILKESINDSLADINPYLSFDYEYVERSYAKLNQWDSAYHYNKLNHEFYVKDRIHESKMKMIDLEAKYEGEKKQLTIAAQNQTISKQKTIQWLSIGGFLLFSLLLFQMYRNGQQKRKANEQLVELDNLKTRLYTNITHEFRTPLTVISGMAAQVKENPKAWLDEGLLMIERNANRLLSLVNQLLDLSKLESGKIALHQEQGNIIPYLKYLVESIHSFAESKKIQLHFYADEDEVIMDYDSEKIQQVIINLLSNALKFTPNEGHVYVDIKHVQLLEKGSSFRKMPFLQITIRDNGLGITEEQLPFIFDRFYQVDDSSTRQKEGSGIGLALVKELVGLMEGEITVKSKVGKETVFKLLLPVRNEAQKSTLPSSELTAFKITNSESVIPIAHNKNGEHLYQAKPRILLIEDNKDVVTYIAACLEGTYDIIVGRDGQEGIDIAFENIPDLIVTDVMMPYKDGYTVCKTLKADERTSHIPVIMLTAKADIDSKLIGLETGADAYLAKPFHKKELIVRIKNLLDLRSKLQGHFLSFAASNSENDTQESTKIPSPESQFMNKLKAVVELHLDDVEFNVEKFCKKIGMSHSQLHRKTTALTGLSPNKFIRYIRMNKAKVLLKSPEKNISAVAFETGFNDPSYFGRVFKKEFGMTPLEWSERN